MKLIGSITSPFVRRIRLLLALMDKNYEFINLDIFTEQDRKFLIKNNPTLKVPALVDGELTLYDSRVIYRYLMEKFQQPPLSWPQENLLTLIDAANDTLVTMLLGKRSELPVDGDVMFYNLQRERLVTVFVTLESEAKNGVFDDWHYPSICLYALLDWVKFRDLYELSSYIALEDFYKNQKSRAGVTNTDPRESI